MLEIEGEAVAVSHLDRVYWPADQGLAYEAVTKRELIAYLITVAPRMLPHVVDRPLTLFRWPNGVAGRRVLQKHGDIALPDFVQRTRIFSDAKGHSDQYLLCNNVPTLVWLAHMGTLEFHVWHSRVQPGPDTPVTSTDFAGSTKALQASIIEYPDYILFDLDPFLYAGTETRVKEPELNAIAFGKAVTIGLALKALLDSLSLISYVKTSGKTGLHVLVPIRRTVTYAVARELARVVGLHLLNAYPEDITVEWSVQKRRGKIFMDTNMNARGKSLVAPYSPRALPGAPVSMPITWAELQTAYPLMYRIPTVIGALRTRRDAWSRLTRDKQAIEERLGTSNAPNDS